MGLQNPPSCADLDISELVPRPKQRQLSYYIFLFTVIVPLCSSVPLSWLYVIYVLRSGLLWHLSPKPALWFAAALCEVFFSAWHVQMALFVAASRPDLHAGNLARPQSSFGRVLQAGLAPPYSHSQSLQAGDDFNFDVAFDEETGAWTGTPGEELVQLRFDDPRAMDFRNYIRIWFGGCPWSHIHLHEMWQWIYWMAYNLPLPPYDAIPAAHRAVLAHTVRLIEARAGARIPRGSNTTGVAPMLPTLDTARVAYYRPFAWYAGVALGDFATKRWLAYKYGLRYGRRGDFEYLLRLPPSPAAAPPAKDRDTTPIVFWHGLGLGVLMYRPFIVSLLAACPDRALLVPLQPHISQLAFHPRFLEPMGPRETVRGLVGVVEELGWAPAQKDDGSDSGVEFDEEPAAAQGLTVISHSNGTYAHAWLLKAHPRLVARSCLIDPVALCLWEGDVCHNFLYRPCLTGMALLMRALIAAELGTANLLQRRFDWASNALWAAQVPGARAGDARRALFVVAGRDGILNGGRVKRHLESEGVRGGAGGALWYEERARHGDALRVGGRGWKRVVGWLRDGR